MNAARENDAKLHDFPYIEHIPSFFLGIQRQYMDIIEENIYWSFFASLMAAPMLSKLHTGQKTMSPRYYIRFGLKTFCGVMPVCMVWTWFTNPFCQLPNRGSN